MTDSANGLRHTGQRKWKSDRMSGQPIDVKYDSTDEPLVLLTAVCHVTCRVETLLFGYIEAATCYVRCRWSSGRNGKWTIGDDVMTYQVNESETVTIRMIRKVVEF